MEDYQVIDGLTKRAPGALMNGPASSPTALGRPVRAAKARDGGRRRGFACCKQKRKGMRRGRVGGGGVKKGRFRVIPLPPKRA